MAIVSDGGLHVCAFITGTAEQYLKGVQNHSLVHVLTRRVLEGKTCLVISGLKYVASHTEVIGQPITVSS